ncbi:MAG: hypothetical protein P8125_01615 [Gemmatimonadota bacterium]
MGLSRWLPGQRRSVISGFVVSGIVPLMAALTAGCGDSPGDGGDTGSLSSHDAARMEAADDTALPLLARSLLPEVETLTGLPARKPLAIALRTREELEAYLVEQLEEQLPADRLAAVQRTYARLGLVPEDLELDELLRSMLLEQVVGYYDPVRDTLYVMEGLDPELVEPVLVHELAHALQDQYQDLDSLMSANRDQNDRAAAAQSALEGHATLVMLEWQLGKLTGGAIGLDALPSLSDLPEVEMLEAAGLEMPALASAPRVIRETLIFPYLGGLEFVRRVRAGREFERWLPLGTELPVSTEQVMHPARAFGSAPDVPVDVTFFDWPPSGWSEVHSDGLGELETRIWLEEFLDDKERAAAAAAGWDGDRYSLVETPRGELLVWVTAWDRPAEADEFAAAAEQAVRVRYSRHTNRASSIERRILAGVPVVVLVDRPLAVNVSRAVPEIRLAIPVPER